MKLTTKLLVIFTLIVTAACTQEPAKIVNHSRSFYGKDSRQNVRSYSKTRHIIGKSKEAVVREGDSLYLIAKRYNVGLHDLIRSNDLRPPYILVPGRKLQIPAPEYYRVEEGDTLYGISRKHDMKINDLIALNELEPPYRVFSGQKIRISKAGKASKEARSLRPSSQSNTVISKDLDSDAKFSWPVRGQVISRFGPKSGGLYNDGINIKAQQGDPVIAAADGVVAYVGNELKGYGNLVIVKHSGGWITAYAHLKESLVTRSSKVERGQKVGLVGSTGNVTSPQLYFGLRKGRDAVDPQKHLK